MSWRERAGTLFETEKHSATGSRGMVVTNNPLGSLADDLGNVVAATHTIHGAFGAKATAPAWACVSRRSPPVPAQSAGVVASGQTMLKAPRRSPAW